MELITGIILLVVGVLQIILFFKLWGMTNDVREIKDRYLRQTNNLQEEIQVDNTEYGVFNHNDQVIEIATGKRMYIGGSISYGKYKCYAGREYIGYIGEFSQTEIKKP